MKALNNVAKVAKVVVKHGAFCLGALALGRLIADERLIKKQRETMDKMEELIDERGELLNKSLKQTGTVINICDEAQAMLKDSIGQTETLLKMFEAKDDCYLEDEESELFDEYLKILKED